MKTIKMDNELIADLRTIRREFVDVKDAGYAAKPYVDALLMVPVGESSYFEDSVGELLMYLKGNLRYWRGGHAADIKASLAQILA